MKLSEFLAKVDVTGPQPGGWLGRCPGHADDEPSLSVRKMADGRLSVHCFGPCSRSHLLDSLGVTEDDLRHFIDDEPDVRPAAAGDPNAPVDADTSAAIERAAYKAMRALLEDADARDYVARRWGVDEDAIRDLGLGLVPDDGGRILVVIRDGNGTAVGAQGRAIAEGVSPKWDTPAGSGLWRVGFIGTPSGSGPVLVTEGPGDALTARAAGYDAVAIFGGKSGRQIAKAVAEALPGTRVLTVPDRVNDLTEWREDDPEAFATDLAAAVSATLAETATVSKEAPTMTYDLTGASVGTDVARARTTLEFLRAKGRDVAYTPEKGWIVWDGEVWTPVTSAEVRAVVHEVGDAFKDAASALAEKYRQDPTESEEERERRDKQVASLRSRTGMFHSSANIGKLLVELEAQPGVLRHFAEFDANKDLLGVGNGVVDLRTGKLRPMAKEDLITRRIPTAYNPEASAPTWEKFLRATLVDDEDRTDVPVVEFMQRFIGYGITGHTKEQCFGVLHGRGGNGKGVLTDTIQSIFRPITTATPFETFEQKPAGGIPNDLAGLKGSRLVLASEGEVGRPMAEAVLKRLTGQDMISARFMRQEFFEFMPEFLILLSTNLKPNFKGQDEGLWRRVVLIPFRHYFTGAERDADLREKLLAEAEGILAWAVAGAVEWYARGLQIPESIRKAVAEYRVESDRLSEFTAEFLVKTDRRADTVKGSELWARYLEWCDDEHEKPVQKATFWDMVAERGFTRDTKANRTVFFRYAKLKTEADRKREDVVARREDAAARSEATGLRIVGGPDLEEYLDS